jgi:glycosyltransferase involved in cell wall biosynthesis
MKKFKMAGIDYFKMMRHYGFIGNLLAKPKNVLTFFKNQLLSTPQFYFLRNNQKAQNQFLRENKNCSNLSEDLCIKLKKAKDFSLQKTSLFVTPPAIAIISNFLPRHNKTSADLRLYHILRILLANKCKIEYIYCGKTSDDLKYPHAFTGDITFRYLPLKLKDYQEIIGKKSYDFLWVTNLWRIEYVRFMAQFTAILKSENPLLKIIIDTMDFHYKEFIRKYDITNNVKDLDHALEFYKNEKVLYRTADQVIVISKEEQENIQEKIAGIRKFRIIPNVHEISDFNIPFHKRKHMCFVGHFGNKHNVDAVEYFLNNIFKSIQKLNPQIEFHIIGRSSERFKETFHSPNVKVIGRLKDLRKALAFYKLFLCPMTYGAGLKGKIGEAMAAGVPVVTTSIGAEGFPVKNGEECFITDSTKEFADRCHQVINDADLWHALSVKSKIMLYKNFSPGVVERKLQCVLK